MSERDAVTIRAGRRQIVVTYTQHDLRFLSGPFLPEAKPFLAAIGLWDSFHVATGMDTRSWTSKPVAPLVQAGRDLLNRLMHEEALFSYDYQYSFPEQGVRKGSGGMSGFKVLGYDASISASVPGQLYLHLLTPMTDGTLRERGFRDIRADGVVSTS